MTPRQDQSRASALVDKETVEDRKLFARRLYRLYYDVVRHIMLVDIYWADYSPYWLFECFENGTVTETAS